MKGARATVLCAAVLLSVPGLRGSQPRPAELRLDPPEVSVGIFYGGTEIQVSGETPPADGLALVASGEEGPVELKTKGRVWGVFWMNVGEVGFDPVPAFYRVVTSSRLAELASPAELERAGAGYPALEARQSFPRGEEERRFFPELIKLREREGLFAVSEGALRLDQGPGGTMTFAGSIYLPALAPEGSYSFRVVAFRSGRAEILAEKTLRVREVGAAAYMKSLAREHGLLYGVVAVATALAAGLLTGFLFDLGSKGSH